MIQWKNSFVSLSSMKVSLRDNVIADRRRHLLSSLLIHHEYNDDQFYVLQAVRCTRRD